MQILIVVGRVFFRTVRIAEKIVGYFLIVGLASIVLLMTMQIVNRYLFQNPLVWTEELCRFIFVWITIMGAGVALRRFELIGVNFIIDKIPPTLQNVVRFLGLLGVTVFIYILTRHGISLLMTARRGATLSAALRVPMYIVYLVFPIGGTIMFLFSIACLIEVITGKHRF
jgi:TRAP-type C4-dicarboxylate transport system permease small subunit